MSTIIGLTGPTGSGKTTVSAFMARHGIETVDCDAVAREAVAPGKPALDALVAAFGKDILLPDGTLNRERLAAVAFADSDALARLNAATHPYILDEIRERIEAYEKAGVRAVLLDAPTLFESGADKLCNRVIAVVAAPDKRKNRIQARDNLAEGPAAARMSAQKPDSFYTDRADDIIYNDSDTDSLKVRLTEMFHEYIRIFKWTI